MRIYPDACVVIYLIEEHLDLYPKIDARLRAHRGDQIVLSELTRLECRVRPLKDQDNGLLSRFDRFFYNPAHSYVLATRTIFDLATQLRATHGLKTPDALHLAAAIEGGCEEFWTNDRRLERAAGDQLRVVSFGA